MVASGSPTMIVGSLSSLYEALPCQEVFSRSTFSSYPFQEARCKAQFCIDGTAIPLAWPR
jgi:hypothetical protein